MPGAGRVSGLHGHERRRPRAGNVIVNGDRKFAARFVVVERTVIQERSANHIIFEGSELIYNSRTTNEDARRNGAGLTASPDHP